MKRKVVVLGGSGMLGSMLVDVLTRNPDLQVMASYRTDKPAGPDAVRWFRFMAGHDLLPSVKDLQPGDWIVNAAGAIKHKIREDVGESVEAAVQVNSVLPFKLHQLSVRKGCRVLQIATDCVFSGREGFYTEHSRHDAEDVYGKTKSLGEVSGQRFHNLRCSIIGPEAFPGGVSLLEWFLSQEPCGSVGGYVNHFWNGVTTLAFARVAEAVVTEKVNLDGVRLQHLVPANWTSKYKLLLMLAEHYSRGGLTVYPEEVDMVNRIVSTSRPDRNDELWEAAGYDGAPSIEHMIKELAAWDYRFKQEGVIQ